MPQVTVPQGILHWTEMAEVAEAPTVVLIHGLGGESNFWEIEQRYLAKRFRVIAVDLRGCGKSEGDWNSFSIDELASDTVTILDAAGVKTADVIGLSMGGLVAQAIATNDPSRVNSLTLVATFAGTNAQSRLFLAAAGSIYGDGATAKQLYNLILPWLFSVEFLTSPRAIPFLCHDEEEGGEQGRRAWLLSLEAQLSFDGREALARIEVPTLIICGDQDRLAPISDSQELVKGIRNAELKIIRGGHLVNVESPGQFLGCIEEFLCHASV